MIDPLAEKYYDFSPYVYCINNPLIYIDPDGKDIRISRNDEDRSIVVEGNFYYNNSQIDPNGTLGIVAAIQTALDSWSYDITSAIGEMEDLEDYTVSVNFSMVNVDVEDKTGDDAISYIKSVADADPIGNSLIHNPTLGNTQNVGDSQYMSANMDNVINDPEMFAGYKYDGGYYTGNTLKHEMGHFFGLRDRTGRTGQGTHIPNDLMSYDPKRCNAIEAFIRVMTYTGLNLSGTKSVIVNKKFRESL